MLIMTVPPSSYPMHPPLWQPVEKPLHLDTHALHVWRFPLKGDQCPSKTYTCQLSPDELARAARFHFPIHSNRYVTSRFALRTILGAYLSTPPDQLCFEYTKFGKPFLVDSLNPQGYAFNMSHSQDLGILAISRHPTLGADVEAIRNDFGGEEVAQSHFAPSEFAELLSLPLEQRPQGFFNCWTRKEAYVKALGAGLQVPLDSFEVSLRPGQPAKFLRGTGPDWRLLTFLASEKFQAAVAYEGPLATPLYFDPVELMKPYSEEFLSR